MMSKIWIFALLVFVSFGYGSSFSAYGRNPKSYKGKGCMVKDVGEMVKGETKPVPNKCERVTCKPPNFEFVGCAPMSISHNCKRLPQDLTKPYPDCCHKFDCV